MVSATTRRTICRIVFNSVGSLFRVVVVMVVVVVEFWVELTVELTMTDDMEGGLVDKLCGSHREKTAIQARTNNKQTSARIDTHIRARY